MFWAGVGVVVLLTVAAVVLLYAYGVAKATDESVTETVRGLIKQIASGDFW